MNLYGSIVKDVITTHGDVVTIRIAHDAFHPWKLRVHITLYQGNRYYQIPNDTIYSTLDECFVELTRLEKIYLQTPVIYTNYPNLQSLYDLDLGLQIVAKDDDYYGTRDFHYFYTTLSYEDAIQTFDKYIFIRGV